MASCGIGVFAISTYNTDYVLTKADQFEKAVEALKMAGYDVRKRSHDERRHDAARCL